MKRRAVLLALSSLASVDLAARAQPLNQLPPFTTVTFAPGSHTSSLTGQLAPGGRAVYSVAAKAGQALNISVNSGSPAVTFQVFRPNATLAKAADGMAVVTGRTLPDAGAADRAKVWIGAIPEDGSYLVLVTRAAGAAAAPVFYNLVVSLQ